MPRKSLLTHVVAGLLIVCVMVLITPTASAIAPVADQQGEVATERQDSSLKATIFAWFAAVWDKFLVFPIGDPPPGDGGGTDNSEEGGGGSGGGDNGPGIDP